MSYEKNNARILQPVAYGIIKQGDIGAVIEYKRARDTDLRWVVRVPIQKIEHFKLDVNRATHGIIATDDDYLVGILMLAQFKQRKFYGVGTWVDSEYRNQGVALELWRCAMKLFDPREVKLVATTNEGWKLGQSLMRQYDGVIFCYDERL